LRYVPLTRRLAETLQAQRHLRGPRVVCDTQGKPLTRKVIQGLLGRAGRRAGVKPGVHMGALLVEPARVSVRQSSTMLNLIDAGKSVAPRTQFRARQ
jgi:hypothetical protein